MKSTSIQCVYSFNHLLKHLATVCFGSLFLFFVTMGKVNGQQETKINACLSVEGDQLQLKYTPNGDLNTAPFNLWNSQLVTIRYPTSTSVTFGAPVSINTTAFPWVQDPSTPGRGVDGGNGYYYVKFLANASSTSYNFNSGQTVTLFSSKLTASSSVAFEIVTGTDWTNANNGDLAISNAILGNLFGAITTTCGSSTYNPTCGANLPTTSNGARCGSGPVSLSATGCNVGGVYKWYAAASGGTALFTGAVYAAQNVTANTTYYVSCSATSCESSRAAAAVTINAVPSISAGAAVTLCVGSPKAISVSVNGGATPYSYAWNPATGLNSTTAVSPTVNLTAVGTSIYSVIVTDRNSCTATAAVQVSANPRLVVNVGAALRLCSGSTGVLSGTASGGSGTGYRYQWNPSTGLTSPSAFSTAISLTSSNSSVSSYTLTATDSQGCLSSNVTSVTLNQVPTVNAGLDVALCSGSSTTLVATAMNGKAPYTYLWDPFTGLSDINVGNPTLTLSTTGPTGTTGMTPYSVRVTDANGCTAVDGVQVTVNPQPTLTLSGALTLCSGTPKSLSATATGGSPGYTYSWQPTQGLSSTAVASPTFSLTVATTTVRTFTITATDSKGCQVSGQIPVTVFPLPATPASLTRVNVCTATSPGTVSLSDLIVQGWALYTTSDRSTPALTGTQVSSLTATGTYYLFGVSNGCYSPGASVKVVIVSCSCPSSPTANAGSNRTVCLGSPVSLTGASIGGGATMGTWSIVKGEGTLSSTTMAAGSLSSVTFTPGASTTSVTLRLTSDVSSTLCMPAMDEVIIDFASPRISVSDERICYNGSVRLNATTDGGTPGYSYKWSQNLGGSTVEAPQISSLSVTTAYSVTVTDALGCTATGGATVRVNPQISVNAGADLRLCSGSRGVLSGTASGGSGFTYSWSRGTGLTSPSAFSTAISLTGSSSSVSSYTLTATDQLSGLVCTASDVVSVTLNPVPTATASNGVAICAGTSTTLSVMVTGGTPGYTYSWKPTARVTGDDTSMPVVSPSMSTLYSVTVTDNRGCIATDVVSVSVNEQPTVNAGLDVALCSGSSTTLVATAMNGKAPYTYLWDPFTGLSDINVGNPTLTLSTTGPTGTTGMTPYSVRVTDANGCTAVDGVQVTVNPQPTLTLSGALTLCSGTPKSLSATATGGSPGYTYSWQPTQGLSSTAVASPTFSLTVATTTVRTFTITATDSKGCQVSGQIPVTVFPLPATPASLTRVNVCTATSPGTVSLSDLIVQGWALYTTSDRSTPALTGTQVSSLTATGTYYLFGVSNGCYSPGASVKVVIVSCSCPSSPTANAGSNRTVCLGSPVSLTGASIGGGATMGTWSIVKGEGTLSSTTMAAGSLSSVTFTPGASTTSVTLRLTSDVSSTLCMPAMDEVIIDFASPRISVSDERICYNGSVRLNATTDGGTPGYSYKWSQNLGGSTVEAPQISSLSVTTAYSVTVTDALGCTATGGATVRVNPQISVNAGADLRLCSGSRGVLSGTASGGSGFTYSWSRGTGLTSPSAFSTAISLTGSSSSVSSYTLTATDQLSGLVCTASDVVSVTLNPVPTAAASNGVVICAGTSTTLSVMVMVTGGTPGYTYSWNPQVAGYTNSTLLVSPIITTRYSVTVTDSRGCTDTDFVQVTVNQVPTANPKITAATCNSTTSMPNADGTIYLPASTFTTAQHYAINMGSTFSSGDVTYATATPIPATGILTNKLANPTAAQTYTVRIFNSNGCYADATVTLQPTNCSCNALPAKADDVSRCGTGSVSLIATGCNVGGTYKWYNVPSGGTVIGTSATYVTPSTQSVSTTYYVSCSATGCESSRVGVEAIINANPNVTAGATPPTCNTTTSLANADGKITLAGTGSGQYYAYSLGTTYSSTVTLSTALPIPANGLIASNLPNPTGSQAYTIRIFTNAGCIQDVPVTLMAATCTCGAQIPTGKDEVSCGPGSVTLTASGCNTGGMYNWYTTASGGVSMKTGATFVTPVLTQTTSYYVSCSATGCESDRKKLTATVSLPPSLSVNPSVTLCAGTSIVLNTTVKNGIGPLKYVWSPAEGLNSTTVSSPMASVTATTVYTVNVTDNNGCIDQKEINVVLAPKSDLMITRSFNKTANTVKLSIQGCTGMVLWNTNESTTSLTVPFPKATTTYSVNCTSLVGCVSSVQTTISASAPAALNVTVNSMTICAAQSTTLLASGCTGGRVLWTGDGVSGFITPTIVVSPATSTNYTVVCTAGADEVITSAKVTVTAVPSLTLTASPSQTVAVGSSLTLSASGCSLGTIRWSNGQTTQSILIIPMAVSSVYSATCSVSTTCKSTASIIISTTATVSQPKLSVIKTVDRSIIEKGDTLTYTITLTNSGTTTATNVTLIDSLDNGLTFLDAVVSTGTYSNGAPFSAWMVPSLLAGTSETMTLRSIPQREGILFNTAMVPNQDTAKVCVSVPIHVCEGSDYEIELNAPPGLAMDGDYQWFKDGEPIDGATGSSFTAVEAGSYTVQINGQVGCPNATCCPTIITEDIGPEVTAIVVPTTCVDGLPQSNGSIRLEGFSKDDSFSYAIGDLYDASFATDNAPIPEDGVIVRNLPNPSFLEIYTVRVTNRSGCYIEIQVMLMETVCDCKPDSCIPLVIKKITRERYNTATQMQN